ncbi:hypothetical protein BAX55_18320 [Acinetobacter baumannii]|nr:hypothetical protein IX88_05645 [Acinetobacter baumannii]AQV15476.1 hypothetical protein BMU11_07880 [Acinetobacter pittii]KKZ31218.1 hypothetical protein UN96_11600 [Acinetobacter baumannii]KKZ32729.1 hypothetical protein UN97_08840 [Acinetobacter baumannii]KKZ36252.1 hypothetical protein UL83_03640 [Acinetobacter baumannii]
MMDVHSQLLILGVLPKHSFGIMVAERKRVDRLASRTQHAQRRPPSVLPLQKGRRVGLHQKNEFFQCSQRSACQSRLAMWPARKA